MPKDRNKSRRVGAAKLARDAADGGLFTQLAFLLEGGLTFGLLERAIAPDVSPEPTRVGRSRPARLANRRSRAA